MPKPTSRPFKGKRLNTFPDSFVCLDIETTGLSPVYDDIIEISALRVEDGVATASFRRSSISAAGCRRLSWS